jgi:hypothetical protein
MDSTLVRRRVLTASASSSATKTEQSGNARSRRARSAASPVTTWTTFIRGRSRRDIPSEMEQALPCGE